MTAVTYRFSVTRPQLISANDRLHWVKKAELTKALRQRGFIEARRSGVHLGRPVRLRVFVGWPDARERDAENVFPTIKPLVDGIVTDGGLLTDDSDRCIRERVWRSDVTRAGCVELELTFEEIP